MNDLIPRVKECRCPAFKDTMPDELNKEGALGGYKNLNPIKRSQSKGKN